MREHTACCDNRGTPLLSFPFCFPFRFFSFFGWEILSIQKKRIRTKKTKKEDSDPTQQKEEGKKKEWNALKLDGWGFMYYLFLFFFAPFDRPSDIYWGAWGEKKRAWMEDKAAVRERRRWKRKKRNKRKLNCFVGPFFVKVFLFHEERNPPPAFLLPPCFPPSHPCAKFNSLAFP